MYTRGPDTGRERVLTRRHGNGDDGAVADARMLGRVEITDISGSFSKNLSGYAKQHNLGFRGQMVVSTLCSKRLSC